MNQQFVLDSSAAVSWFLEDEKSKGSRALDILIDDGAALVPSLWLYEISNALFTAQKRSRLPAWEAGRILNELFALNIDVDDRPKIDTLMSVLLVADTYGLSAYDAAYLELALRHRLPIATYDTKLAASAKKAGLVVL